MFRKSNPNQETLGTFKRKGCFGFSSAKSLQLAALWAGLSSIYRAEMPPPPRRPALLLFSCGNVFGCCSLICCQDTTSRGWTEGKGSFSPYLATTTHLTGNSCPIKMLRKNNYHSRKKKKKGDWFLQRECLQAAQTECDRRDTHFRRSW